ncbi:MAG: replication-associated recombination protein A [Clostridia bacterium]|nr:replication-associated recombination protein A [Clostridia bacterium]MDD4686113.1 replication-associated recombination protein A [Clostridia bacterium]
MEKENNQSAFQEKLNTKPPLAERMRPTNFEDFVGQKHIIGKQCLLRRAIEANQLGSCIFFGPPGSGKTTLANIVTKVMKGEFKKLSAVSSGVSDVKDIIQQANINKRMFGTQTYLLLDECHRWSKAQSDYLLSAIENGEIVFIGATTENPFTSMTKAIISRCRIFEFKALNDKDVISALKRAIKDEKGLGDYPIEVEEDALKHFAWASSGDVRMALNALELAVLTTPFNKDKKIIITKSAAEQSIQKKALSIDENQYYDMLSAFCKSIRGSDTEAALYYSQRMLLAGIDPLVIARRLVAHSSEDIGMADSNALLLSVSAMYAIEKMGAPEGLIPLTHAIIYACEAEKSNSVFVALNYAKNDAQNIKDDNIPDYLKNHPVLNNQKGMKYKYPHDFNGYIKQQYLPNSLKDRIYYEPSTNGKEKNLVRKKFK